MIDVSCTPVGVPERASQVLQESRDLTSGVAAPVNGYARHLSPGPFRSWVVIKPGAVTDSAPHFPVAMSRTTTEKSASVIRTINRSNRLMTPSPSSALYKRYVCELDRGVKVDRETSPILHCGVALSDDPPPPSPPYLGETRQKL